MCEYEIRPAQAGEEKRQKEIWKRCFRDSDEFIEFFYTKRYSPEKTMVLLQNGVIASMLTMMPVTVTSTGGVGFPATMLYAIATHPDYRQRGLANSLMDFTHQYLRQNNCPFSVLVPAEKGLFDFYRRQGYQEGFGVRETVLAGESLARVLMTENCQGKLTEIDPQEYNRRRNLLLGGSFHISYSVEKIVYQQKLSRRSGSDIYGLEIGGNKGCAAVERIAADSIIVKEMLIADEDLLAALRCLAQKLPATRYVIRTPIFWGEEWQGAVRPFGMIKALRKKVLPLKDDGMGYLGLAFD